MKKVAEKKNIFFLCPDINKPSGGVRQIYRQVDILNRNGFSSFVIHEKRGFRCDWFANTTEIRYKSNLVKADLSEKVRRFLSRVRKSDEFFYECWLGLKHVFFGVFMRHKYKEAMIGPADVLVVPEVFSHNIENIGKGIKKIIFNQNAHNTFLHYPLEMDTDMSDTAYLSKEVRGAIVVSEHNWNYVSYAFPSLKVTRVHLGIDPSLFKYNANKKKQIAFMPRKLSWQVQQVINILRVRGVGRMFKFVPIVNKTIEETAAILEESLLFLSFNMQEGFGLPPAEAMACGCIVVGYHGFGGREYFNEEHCYPIDNADVLHFAQTVEKVVQEYEKDKSQILEKGRKAAEFIRKTYTLEQEEADSRNFWRELLKETASGI